MLSTLLFFVKYILTGPSFLCDATFSGQIGFQRPATQTMEQLVDLHHDIFSLLLFLCILVFYLLAVSIYKFNATNLATPRNFFFTAHTTLEIS
jgi:heme/copper-type cytochrome/quinol oxidase subunit 2